MANLCEGIEPTVVPNLVDTDFFKLPEVPPRDPFDLLCVAMLEKKKGIDVLLEALARLHEAGKRYRIQLIGDGSEREALRSLVAQLGLTDAVVFSGLGSRAEIRQAMWNTRAFVLPSRVETFGLVLAEALACGLPVVATKCGGPESFVRQPFGRVVPAGDPFALASALAEVIASTQDVASQAAHDYVVAEFGPIALRARLERIYGAAEPQ